MRNAGLEEAQAGIKVSGRRKLKVKSLSRVQLFATPWTVAYQALQSMGFSRQEYWIGLPFPSPGDLPNPGIEPGSPALQTDALPSEPPGKPSPADILLIFKSQLLFLLIYEDLEGKDYEQRGWDYSGTQKYLHL